MRCNVRPDVAPLQIIERLATGAGRLPGSEQDRRTTAMLAAELESMGRRAEVEEIRVRPGWQLTFALFAAIAAGGTVLSTVSAPAGAVLLLVTAAAMYGDLATGFHTLRLATPPRRTANVSSPERRESPAARVIVTAHHDAGRTGLLYMRPRRRRPARRRRATLTSPLHFLFWSAMVALVAAIARLAVDNEALTAVQFVLAVVFLTYVVLLLDTAAAAPSPGAADNASGVAVVLEAARRLEAERPALVETWVVLTGAGDSSGLGMKAWLEEHAGALRGVPTYFVNVKGAARGRLCHVVGEGYATIVRNDERLARLAERAGSERHVWRIGTDASVAASHGFPSITLAALDNGGRIEHSHRASDTPENVDPAVPGAATDTLERLVRMIDTAVAAERRPRARA